MLSPSDSWKTIRVMLQMFWSSYWIHVILFVQIFCCVRFETDNKICFIFCSEDMAKLAARKYARIVQKLGFPVRICTDTKWWILVCPYHSSGAVWESRWLSCAVRPNELYGFSGRKAVLNHAHACLILSLICQPTSEDIKQHLKKKKKCPYLFWKTTQQHINIILITK